MLWWQRFFLKMDEAGDKGGGGGGGSGDKGGDKGGTGNAGSVTLTKEQFDALNARLAKLEGTGGDDGKGGKGGKDDGDDLAAKARREREENEKGAARTKDIEKSVGFIAGSKEWLKTHASILPKNFEGIFAAAEKETYADSVEKANDLRVGMIQEFFAQQSNLDLLTETQKEDLAEFQKLTKTVKQERAARIFATVFEPTFEMLKRIKKAEQVNKGYSNPSGTEDAYKQRLIKESRKHHLGEKQHGS